MIELTKTNRITVAILLMLCIILIGLLTMATPKYFFKSDPSSVIADLKNGRISDYTRKSGKERNLSARIRILSSWI